MNEAKAALLLADESQQRRTRSVPVVDDLRRPILAAGYRGAAAKQPPS
jgi:hypothetical protein